MIEAYSPHDQSVHSNWIPQVQTLSLSQVSKSTGFGNHSISPCQVTNYCKLLNMEVRRRTRFLREKKKENLPTVLRTVQSWLTVLQHMLNLMSQRPGLVFSIIYVICVPTPENRRIYGTTKISPGAPPHPCDIWSGWKKILAEWKSHDRRQDLLIPNLNNIKRGGKRCISAVHFTISPLIQLHVHFKDIQGL